MDAAQLFAQLFKVVGKPVISLLFGVAFVIFVYGIVKFIRNADNDTGRKEGKDSIIYGIVGMVIMVAVFGIIRIIAGTIGVPDPSPTINQEIFPEVNGGL